MSAMADESGTSIRSRTVVALGSRVVLEDVDDGSCEEYVLVPSPESNPVEGRLSSESPVARAIAGHREGELIDVRAPRRIRHLRIAEVRTRRTGCRVREQ